MDFSYGRSLASFSFTQNFPRVLVLGLLLACCLSHGLRAATPQTITFPAIADHLSTDAPFTLSATASSGLPVSYAIVSPEGVATISGNTLTLTGAAGAVTVKVSQAGDGTFDAAPEEFRSFQVTDLMRFVQVAASPVGDSSAGIRAEGTLWTWGANVDYQLGDGTSENKETPVKISTATNWKSVALGPYHGMAVRLDGTLWAWGSNASGQLGDGTQTDRKTPVQIAPGSSWSAVSCGGNHTVALRSDGTLWSWGNNNVGQLGDGTATLRTSPVQIGNAATWTFVSCGDNHSLALRNDGTLWAWGQNELGQLGDGSEGVRNAPVQIGVGSTWTAVAAGFRHTLAVRSDGTLWGWGYNNGSQLALPTTVQNCKTPVQIGSSSDWVSVSCGAYFSLARRSDQSVWGWGSNASGQLGEGNLGTTRVTPAVLSAPTPFTMVATGSSHVLALGPGGDLWAWGKGDNGQLGRPNPPSRTVPVQITTSTWKGVASGGSLGGGNCSYAVRSDGTLWTWGGAILSPSFPVQVDTINTWNSVICGEMHRAAVRTDGTLWTWGYNSYGQLGHDTGISVLSPTQVGTASDWTPAVSCGDQFTAAIRADGTLWTWGYGESYRLGGGATRSKPEKISNATNWTAVACQLYRGYALRTDGTLWTWGGGTDATPVPYDAATDWAAIVCGPYHSLALKTDGSLWTWGIFNTYGQLGNGSTSDGFSQIGGRWKAIACGQTHSLAISSNGTLWGWGYGIGLSPVEISTAPNWKQVTGAEGCSAALRSDGTLWTWGDNRPGNLGDVNPAIPRRITPAPSSQTLVFPPFMLSGLGQPVTLAATASSGLPVSYTVVGPATLRGNTLTPTGYGTFTVAAYQNGDHVWQLAPSLVRTLVFGPDLALTGNDRPILSGASKPALDDHTDFGQVTTTGPAVTRVFTIANIGDAPLILTGADVSGPQSADFVVAASHVSVPPGGTAPLEVTFAPLGDGLRRAFITLSSNDRDGDSLTFAIQGSGIPFPAQAVTFPAISPHLATDVPFVLNAFASSGLPVTYSIVSTGNVATVSGSTMTFTGLSGAVTVRATQEGDATYAAAAPVFQTFIVQDAATRFVKVAAATSGFHSAGIRADGTLWTWGRNSDGQIGDNTLTDRAVPIQVGAASTWAAVAAGAYHTVALQSNGTLWAWGANSYGQLGDGSTVMRKTPVQIGTDTTWAAIACGEYYTMALRTDGTLWSWGDNSSGQLGSGSTTSRSTPAQVGSATWSRIACGTSHTMGIATDGTLWAWGVNNTGQLGDNSQTNRSVPVKIGTATTWAAVAGGQSHTLAIRTDGTLWAWGWNGAGELGGGTASFSWRVTPAQLGTDTNWAIVAGANGRSFAGRSDGSLWAWGDNSGGRLGDGTAISRTTPTQIAASGRAWAAVVCGYLHTTALSDTGALWSWGDNGYGQLGSGTVASQQTTPALLGAATWRKVAASNHTAAIRSDGTLWTWGDNDEGQLGTGTVSKSKFPAPVQVGTAADWTAVAAGSRHTAALRADGSLWTWGYNATGQLGDGTSTRRTTPVQIGAGAVWTAIACGDTHTVARRADGTLWAWGSNYNGELGDGTTTARSSPVQVGTATIWSNTLACGANYTLALRTDGSLWAWGYNGSRQLGDGTTTQRSAPVQIGTATDWIALAAGDSHALALRSDGGLWGWGSNVSGALGLGSQDTQSVPLRIGTAQWRAIACGDNFSLAVCGDGTLWTAGVNYYGMLGDGTTVDKSRFTPVGSAANWAGLEGGSIHSLALREDGALWAWGSNTEGRLGLQDTSVPVRTAPALGIQSITFPALTAPAQAGQPVLLEASASSGLPITYTVTGPAVLAGGAVVPTGYGIATVTAYQAGEGAWQAAVPVERSFTLGPRLTVTGNGHHLLATPTMENGTDFGPLRVVDSSGSAARTHTFTLANTGNVGLSVLSISGTGLHPGDFNISVPAASQVPPGGSTTFQITFSPLAAGLRQAVVSITSNDQQSSPLTFLVQGTGVAAPAQVISFPEVSSHTTTDAPFALPAETSSGLPISYSIISGGNVAAQSGGTLTLTGAPGAVTVRATQAGDGTFNAAPAVVRTFVVQEAGTRFAQVACGASSSHGAAIREDGTLWTWGSNSYGQLAVGNSSGHPDSHVPVQAGTASGWTAVACGSQHTMARRADGTLWGWGRNAESQLGDGTTTTRYDPVEIGVGASWSQVSCGGYHTAALRSDGTLWTWGSNTYGQLGDGSATRQSSPVQIGAGTDWTAVVCGRNHTLALRADGTLWAWGDNSYGQLGEGTLTQRNAPVQIGVATAWTSVAAGIYHTLAVDSSGQVWSWGANTDAQLGIGQVLDRRTTPARVEGIATPAAAVVCGESHSLALLSDGTLLAWGANDYGQLGDGIPTGTARSVPAPVGGLGAWRSAAAMADSTLALSADGTLRAWGRDVQGQLCLGVANRADRGRVGSATDWTAATAGSGHTLGLRAGGKLWAWGSNGFGQLGMGIKGNPTQFNLPVLAGTSVTASNSWSAVSAGTWQTLARRDDGTLWVWGGNLYQELGYSKAQLGGYSYRDTPQLFSAVSGPWSKVYAADGFSIVLNASGRLLGMGTTAYGQLGTFMSSFPYRIDPAARSWSSAAPGLRHTLLLKADGTLWSCGNNQYGQRGFSQTSATPDPIQVGTAINWTAIAAGGFQSAGLRADGSLWVWGSFSEYAAPGAPPSSSTPAQVAPGTRWTAVACGRGHLVAVRTDGSLWAMGLNDFGQLGDGTLNPAAALVRVGAATNWTSVACGQYHTVALRNDGTLWAWGINNAGQLGTADTSLPRLAWPLRVEQTLDFPALGPLTPGQPVTLAATASSGLLVTYTVAGPATLSGNVLTPTGAGAITVTAHQNGDDVWQIADSAMQTVQAEAAMNPQQSWRQTHFGTTANTGDAADTADADHDGLPNLIEFAFGLAPTAGTLGAQQLPQPQCDVAAQTFTYTFTEPAGVAGAGLVYGAIASTSLEGGSWVAVPDTGSGTTHVFTVSTTGRQQVFIRLQVTAP